MFRAEINNRIKAISARCNLAGSEHSFSADTIEVAH